MAVALTQVISESSSSGAEIIDGSLKFDKNKSQYLNITFSGSSTTYTSSLWVKRHLFGGYQHFFFPSETANCGIGFEPDDYITVYNGAHNLTSKVFRDTSSWYHLVLKVSSGTATLYVNGEVAKTGVTGFALSGNGKIGNYYSNNYPSEVSMSQVYTIDGQALDPTDFAYTDPLTGTWRPKKYTGTFTGTNTFYLPFDGSAPIGKDQSGNGNDWQPINFGGSVELPKATGAIPILNTDQAGSRSKPGARTDKKTYTVTASGGDYYLDGDQQPTLDVYRGGSYTFDYTGATSHPLYLSSLPDGKHNSEAYSVTFDGEDSWIDVANGVTIGTSAFTWECFFYVDNFKSFITIFDTRETSSSESGQIYLGARSDGLVYVWSGDYKYQTNRVSTGEWHHIALVKDTNNLMHLYVDGTHAYKVSGNDWTHTDSVNPLLRIGQTQYSSFESGSDFEWEGKLSNVRITVGQALYTSNFTPPTTTLTTTSQGAIASNVKLLCCQSSSATTAAVTPGTLSTSGNAAAVNVSPFLYDNNHGFFGVNTATLNTTKITIPHWAPDTLYYYCNAHSGMGGSINVSTDILKADPYAWMCKLALPLTGSIATDLSPNINVNSSAKTVSSTSIAASSVRHNFYASSAYYGIHSDAYRQEVSANADLEFGDTPWTIECWCYRDTESTSNSYQTPWSYRTDGSTDYHQAGWISFLVNGSSTLHWYYGTGSGNTQFGPTETIGVNRWTHIVSIWDGKGNIELYFDGIRVHSQAVAKSDWGSSTLPFYIGDQAYNGGVRGLSGYMQDFRIYKGVAKYTTNFAVPSTSPDILPDSPSGITYSSALTKITDGAVTFDGDGDWLELPDHADLEMGTGDFTIECFINLNHVTPTACWRGIVSLGDGHTSSDGITIYAPRASIPAHTAVVILNQVNPALSGTTSINDGGWHHIALVRNSGTTKLYVDGYEEDSVSDTNNYAIASDEKAYIGKDAVCGTTYYQGGISNVRIVKGTAVYTSNFNPPTEPLTNITNTKLLCCQSTTKTGISDAAVLPSYAITVKSSNSGIANTGNLTAITSSGNYYYDNRVSSGGTGSAWIQVDFASTQSSVTSIKLSGGSYTAGSLFDLYVNGVLVANDRSTQTLWAEDTITISSTNIDSIRIEGSNGYALGALKFNDTLVSGSIGGITGNGNVTGTNFNPFTDDIDAIRGRASGYATLNPLAFYLNSLVLSNGNLTCTSDNTNTNEYAFGNMLLNGRKIYYEFSLDNAPNVPGAASCRVGICRNLNGATSEIVIYNGTGNFETLGTIDSTGASDRTYSTGDTIGFAFDCINGSVQYFKNGIKVGTKTFTVGTDDWTPHIRIYVSSGSPAVTTSFNFGQKPFKFPPPDGFQPLNTSNVRPSTVISRPDKHFTTVLYTGTGTNGANGINVGFQPDLVWIKERTGAYHHALYDSVRGVQKSISTSRVDLTEHSESAGLNRFTGAGFDLASGDGFYYVNRNNQPYIAWCWKAGGPAVTNTDGTLSTQVSVNQDAGFSIATYTTPDGTATNFGHGLGKKPAFALFKSRNDTGNWAVYHQSMGTNTARLSTTGAQDTSADAFNSTAPTDTLMYLGTWAGTNGTNINWVSYLWSEIEGFSKFGSYVGNASGTSGPYVHCGFSPALIMIKDISTSSSYQSYKSWVMYDSKRPGYNNNQNHNSLYANAGYEEGKRGQGGDDTYPEKFVITSNGFKVQYGASSYNVETNENGNTFIYCAWAEAPTSNLYGAQANAR